MNKAKFWSTFIGIVLFVIIVGATVYSAIVSICYNNAKYTKPSLDQVKTEISEKEITYHIEIIDEIIEKNKEPVYIVKFIETEKSKIGFDASDRFSAEYTKTQYDSLFGNANAVKGKIYFLDISYEKNILGRKEEIYSYRDYRRSLLNEKPFTEDDFQIYLDKMYENNK